MLPKNAKKKLYMFHKVFRQFPNERERETSRQDIKHTHQKKRERGKYGRKNKLPLN